MLLLSNTIKVTVAVKVVRKAQEKTQRLKKRLV
jgi:hypothetical protein